jgi:DNA-binding transcriptional ArsR family regulator
MTEHLDDASAIDRRAELFLALGHPNRLRIVEFLRGGERCQCEIQPALGIEQSNLSRHIKILAHAGILASRRDGTRILLRVADARVFALLDGLRDAGIVASRARAPRIAAHA